MMKCTRCGARCGPDYSHIAMAVGIAGMLLFDLAMVFGWLP